MSLGVILSSDDAPNTDYCYFMANDNIVIRKGMYVSIADPEGEIVGYIDQIQTSNKYYEFIEGIQGYDEPENALPIGNWHHTVGRVKIQGMYKTADKNGDKKPSFKRVDYPPKPGTRVTETENEKISKFLGFKDKGVGLNLGNVRYHDVNASISMTRLLQKHLAILAMSGAGKSHLTSVLIEELLDRPKESGRIAVVIIDVHGEYLGFKEDAHYGSKTDYINGKEIKFSLRTMSVGNISSLVSGFTGSGRDLLENIIGKLKSENKSYSINEIIHEIQEAKEGNKNVKEALARSIYRLRSYGIFSKSENYPSLESTIKPGKLMIIDLSELMNNMRKKAIVAIITKKLFELRMNNRIPPFALIVEEAHNFAREKERSETAVARSVLEKIAREGRKFGAALCLISQRPANLSTTALSQCNTHIIMRVTNPNDLKYIEAGAEGIDSRTIRSITSLNTGEMIMVGSAVNYPTFVQVRNRKSKKVEKGRPLHEQGIEWEKKQQDKEEDIGAYVD